MNRKKNILIVGADLTSNGGIASVIKSYYSAYQRNSFKFYVKLLKTCYYKDKWVGGEVYIFFKSLILYLRDLIWRKVSLVHVHSSSHISFYRKSVFVVLAKIFRKKIILHLHSSNFDFFLNHSWFVSRIFLLTDCLVVLCSEWERALKSRFPTLYIQKIENPFHGELHPREEKSNLTTTVNILFVGFLIESKGIEDLIQIARRFNESKRVNVRFQIAGKGDLEHFIKDSIAKYDLKNIVELKGWIAGKDKDMAFREADIFFLPSHKEGMPISILEAMSYGLPILSTKISGIPDLIQDGINGYLDNPGDIEGLCTHLEQLVNNPEMRKQMGENSISRVASNSEDVIFNQVADLYNSLLQ